MTRGDLRVLAGLLGWGVLCWMSMPWVLYGFFRYCWWVKGVVI